MSSRWRWIHIQVVLIVSFALRAVMIAHHHRRSRDSCLLIDVQCLKRDIEWQCNNVSSVMYCCCCCYKAGVQDKVKDTTRKHQSTME